MNAPSPRFQGRVCLVTGAASGIGLACARRMAEEGAQVVGVDLDDSPAWQSLGLGEPMHRMDVRDFGAQRQLVDEIHARHGRLDVLVTAAGVAGGGAAHQLEEEEWDRVVDINLKATWLSCKAALQRMAQARSGSVITIASIEGLNGCEGGSCYNASKGGVVLLTKNIAMDYGRLGIRANAICPGFIETPMFSAVMGDEGMAAYRDRVREQHMLGRFGRPEEIAATAAFLGSDDASFISGQALAVDGGFTAGCSFGTHAMMGLT